MKHNQYNLRPNTMYHGDCLDVMQHWEKTCGECVDLIYLDPPFNSNANYNIIYGKDQTGKALDEQAQFTAFNDTWYWSHEAAARVRRLSRVNETIAGLKMILGESGMLAYVSYMYERVQVMHAILKDTGSFYFHCDPTAAHYIKVVLDHVFGAKHFRNEIIWFYHDTPGRPKTDFPRKHDTIFRYAKSDKWIFNADAVRVPILPESMERYKTPRKLGGKEYLGGKSASIGKIPETVWTIPAVKQNSKEALGYRTQKPLQLMERIVQASSNAGDIVLDPFCGCGTTAGASWKLKRKFLGIDISPYAITRVCRERLKNARGVQIKGLPTDMQSASELAKAKPFMFEHWAISCLPGFMPNDKQTADGGVDGRGWLLHPPLAENGDELSRLCIAQVKGGKVSPDAIRALVSQITGGKASVGVLITLQKMPVTPTVKQAVVSAGAYTQAGGIQVFDRLLFWSIEDYFSKVMPKLPNMAHPLTGKPMLDTVPEG